MTLEDKDGYPLTATAGFGMLLTFAVVTCGVTLLLLSVYLCLWIKAKGRSALPLYATLLSAVALILSECMELLKYPPNLCTGVSTAALCGYIFASFALRREVIRYYREKDNWIPQISLFGTLFFSSIAINDALTPDRVPVRNPMTSLDLQ